MAKMTKKETTTVTVTGYVLELSIEEAQALIDVLSTVGGHPDHSRRGDTDRVYEALTAVGLKFTKPEDKDYKGSVYFEDR